MQHLSYWICNTVLHCVFSFFYKQQNYLCLLALFDSLTSRSDISEIRSAVYERRANELSSTDPIHEISTVPQ